jgi:hypothetical protein
VEKSHKKVKKEALKGPEVFALGKKKCFQPEPRT